MPMRRLLICRIMLGVQQLSLNHLLGCLDQARAPPSQAWPPDRTRETSTKGEGVAYLLHCIGSGVYEGL